MGTDVEAQVIDMVFTPDVHTSSLDIAVALDPVNM